MFVGFGIMKQITMNPIGVIHSPYKKTKNMPIQGVFKPRDQAWIELIDRYTSGLKDLDGFSHAIIIYYFHQSQEEQLEGMPFLEQVKHGVFAMRSPHRPNHIGFSVIKIEKIDGNRVYFSEVDVLDQTPVLDIKPYIRYFDYRSNVVCGWVDKHFEDGKIPNKSIIR
jgi:tRNA-Thr(GGU) m(6)t(6)A37 methyltransferase TsaA